MDKIEESLWIKAKLIPDDYSSVFPEVLKNIENGQKSVELIALAKFGLANRNSLAQYHRKITNVKINTNAMMLNG